MKRMEESEMARSEAICEAGARLEDRVRWLESALCAIQVLVRDADPDAAVAGIEALLSQAAFGTGDINSSYVASMRYGDLIETVRTWLSKHHGPLDASYVQGFLSGNCQHPYHMEARGEHVCDLCGGDDMVA